MGWNFNHQPDATVRHQAQKATSRWHLPMQAGFSFRTGCCFFLGVAYDWRLIFFFDGWFKGAIIGGDHLWGSFLSIPILHVLFWLIHWSPFFGGLFHNLCTSARMRPGLAVRVVCDPCARARREKSWLSSWVQGWTAHRLTSNKNLRLLHGFLLKKRNAIAFYW